MGRQFDWAIATKTAPSRLQRPPPTCKRHSNTISRQATVLGITVGKLIQRTNLPLDRTYILEQASIRVVTSPTQLLKRKHICCFYRRSVDTDLSTIDFGTQTGDQTRRANFDIAPLALKSMSRTAAIAWSFP